MEPTPISVACEASHRHVPSLASHPSLERVHSDEEHDEEEKEILKANRIESEIQKDKILANGGIVVNVPHHTAEIHAAKPPGGWFSGVSDFFRHLKHKFIISKELEEAFVSVLSLMRHFLGDINATPFDMMTTLMLLSAYDDKRPVVYTDVKVPREKVLELQYFSKYAIAAYGWMLLYGLYGRVDGVLVGFARDSHTNRRVLLEHTGLAEDDVIMTNWDSAPFTPGHFVAVDHIQKVVVLTIRGTFSARDCLVDLVCHYVPFEVLGISGKAHSGMLTGAKKLWDAIWPTISLQLQKHPGYKLRLAGHSLGAGIAGLITMFIIKEHPDIDVHCYCYASPAVVTLDIADACRHKITTVVFHDDIVPRLSYGSLVDLKRTMLAVLQDSSTGGSNFKRIFQTVAAGNSLGPTLTKKLENFFHCSATPSLEAPKTERAERLYVPGRVYFIYRKGKHRHIEASSPSLFADIILSPTIFVDHMPYEYEENFPRVLEHLDAHLHPAVSSVSSPAVVEIATAAAPPPNFSPNALPEMVLPSVASATSVKTPTATQSLVISEN